MIVGVNCVEPVITVAVDVAIQPEVFVTSTVYEPAAIALYVAIVAPLINPVAFDHF